jgi:hypothetical protein
VQENFGIVIGEQEFVALEDGGYMRIHLARAPVISVSEVYDTFLSEAVAEDAYLLDAGSAVQRVDRYFWKRGDSRYRITYTAGYTETTAPKCLLNALLQLVHRMFHARGGLSDSKVGDVSTTLQSLDSSDIATWLAPLRTGSIF